MIRNTGINFKLEELEQSDKDWVFWGWTLSSLAKIPLLERSKWLPRGETQRGREDMMDCVPRAFNNDLAAQFTWLVEKKLLPFGHETWLRENGYIDENNKVDFSDAFVAINAGTNRGGTSFKAGLEAIRKNGLIPKKMLPLDSSMTFEEYHNSQRINGDMVHIGNEFRDRFKINYEKVYEKDFSDVLKDRMICVGGYAWPPVENDEHIRTDTTPNHLFLIYGKPDYMAFDNYIDRIGNDFIKRLASDFNFYKHGYALSVNVKPTVQTSTWAIHPWMRARKLLGCIF